VQLLCKVIVPEFVVVALLVKVPPVAFIVPLFVKVELVLLAVYVKVAPGKLSVPALENDAGLLAIFIVWPDAKLNIVPAPIAKLAK